MRITQTTIAIAAFAGAAILAMFAAWWAAVVIENRSAVAVTSRLLTSGITWATVEADGLQVQLHGTAPNEAARFRAVNLAGSVVESSRVRDLLEVTPVRAIEAPRFSVEMLRNDDGISLIGLLPADAEGAASQPALADEAAAIAEGIAVSDMLETAAFPAPAGWDAALAYGLQALKVLPRAKISVAADRVAITAISGSEAEKRRLESELARRKPEGLAVALDISAPRPVLTPFTLRFVKDAEGARFDACSADTERARARILAAAVAAGTEGKTPCTIGLGVPSPRWAEAAEAGIRAVDALGAGSVTFSDADVTLLAAAETPQATFDRVVGELQTALPEVFSLKSTLPPKPTATQEGPAEFTATLAEDGQVQLRGRVTDEVLRRAVDSYARANFGAAKVYTATRLDPELPDGWPVRVFAGIEALAELHHGTLLVRADTVEVAGITGSQDARARIAQVLSDKLGQGKTFKVAVSYDESLDPLAALPTPQECIADINAALARQKITFAPGSAEIAATAHPTLEALAAILIQCPDVTLEIGGHTDAQGSTEGNRALSQARAEAVLLSLQGRRAPVAGLTAFGYGEDRPIADNGSEEGREANRRIEFRMTGDAAAPAAGTTADTPGETDAPATDAPTTEAGLALAPDAAPAGSGTPLDCVSRLNAILAHRQISFKPGSAEIDSDVSGTLDALAIILGQCPQEKLEIGGHTDAQGSTEGNRKLSQSRAEAVLAALQTRGVAIDGLTAFGYGEGRPLADNGTKDGREANRRIEFTLAGAADTATDPAADEATPPEAEERSTPAEIEPTGDGPADEAPAGNRPADEAPASDDAAADSTTPDFSADTSPSAAPAEATKRPKTRPEQP
ncbi:MAG TPA: OmpA family protein [Paracoccaceae bacterium]